MTTSIANIQAANNPATANLAQAKTASGASAAEARLSQNLDDFLKLLTTQLTNQDPTQPMETNQFTQQIAQLSQVEQGINTNKNLESLINMFTNSQINGVVSYIGKRVESAGNIGQLENGAAMFAYNLDTAASNTTVTLYDSTGKVVFTGQGDTRAGRNEVYWDGRDSNTGQQLEDGNYSIEVKATDAAGNEIKSSTYTTGRVTAVDLVNGQPELSLGTITMPLDKVLNIRTDILAPS